MKYTLVYTHRNHKVVDAPLLFCCLLLVESMYTVIDGYHMQLLSHFPCMHAVYCMEGAVPLSLVCVACVILPVQSCIVLLCIGDVVVLPCMFSFDF